LGNHEIEFLFEPRKNAIVDAIDYKIPVTQLRGMRGIWRYASSKATVIKFALELPFDNSNLSMIIGLPAHTLHLRLMEMKIKKFAETLKEMDVHIQLPKFSIEFRTDLVDILKKVSRSF